jgi:hypothetical protein
VTNALLTMFFVGLPISEQWLSALTWPSLSAGDFMH